MFVVKPESKKEAAILEAGRELFWKYGFRKVSVDEICKAAGVSKMTFYRYFNDKATLAKKIFDNELEKSMEQFRKIMQSGISVPEKMKHILQMKSESVKNISGDFIRDFYSDNESGLKAHIEQKTASSWETILDVYRQAQQRGEFRKDMKPEILLYISQKVTDLFNDPYLTGLCGGPAGVIMELARLFTYGISPDPFVPENQ
ncbi:transcriptional regulator, TetR family [Lentimicrobium saccharophilum]|uniref:Transcriptional regulator, TetR family n=1 Tax=Lentimicrobium saccharophilum TaxID=1678841 RepID=A0A0S7BY59_9BACT|nr:TetR/AcrR family transcriptional regulator [Lentimicrobium saccharophilum]GAP42228.1 transcriptional regulator, TetR family [Lentimicrobium saccharophilum]